MIYESYYTVDFSNVRRWQDVHPTIKRALEFPSYYGENLDAMWDCLGEMEPSLITIKGVHAISRNKDCQYMLDRVLSVFEDAQKELIRLDIVFED